MVFLTVTSGGPNGHTRYYHPDEIREIVRADTESSVNSRVRLLNNNWVAVKETPKDILDKLRYY